MKCKDICAYGCGILKFEWNCNISLTFISHFLLRGRGLYLVKEESNTVNIQNFIVSDLDVSRLNLSLIEKSGKVRYFMFANKWEPC